MNLPRMCGWCGKAIVEPGAKSCHKCTSIEANSTNVPGPEHALTGGRWMLDDRGIQRWVEL